MPSYKLYYFPLRGRGEISRFIFKHADVPFEDIRIPQEEWLKFKPTTPYGSLPVLEVDGKQLAGSPSIHRYLGEEFGLAGSNAFENAEIDSIVGVANDYVQEVWKFHYEKDETKKEEIKKKLVEETSPKFLGIFEKIITNGWVYGGKVTYADFVVYIGLQWAKPLGVLEKYPNVQKQLDQVEALPNIAKWLKERPETPY